MQSLAGRTQAQTSEAETERISKNLLRVVREEIENGNQVATVLMLRAMREAA